MTHLRMGIMTKSRRVIVEWVALRKCINTRKRSAHCVFSFHSLCYSFHYLFNMNTNMFYGVFATLPIYPDLGPAEFKHVYSTSGLG